MVTCRLTACTLGSASGPTLAIKYGKPLPLPFTGLLREGIPHPLHLVSGTSSSFSMVVVNKLETLNKLISRACVLFLFTMLKGSLFVDCLLIN